VVCAHAMTDKANTPLTTLRVKARLFTGSPHGTA
jgi:hypothetical protein